MHSDVGWEYWSAFWVNYSFLSGWLQFSSEILTKSSFEFMHQYWSNRIFISIHQLFLQISKKPMLAGLGGHRNGFWAHGGCGGASLLSTRPLQAGAWVWADPDPGWCCHYSGSLGWVSAGPWHTPVRLGLCGPPCRVNKQGDVGVISVEGKLFFVLVRQDKDFRCPLPSKVPVTWYETPSRVQISSFPGLWQLRHSLPRGAPAGLPGRTSHCSSSRQSNSSLCWCVVKSPSNWWHPCSGSFLTSPHFSPLCALGDLSCFFLILRDSLLTREDGKSQHPEGF